MSQEHFMGGSLTNPVKIGDLTKNGSLFQVNEDFHGSFRKELFDLGFDEDLDDEAKRAIKMSVWDGTFDELRLQMTKIDDDIYKRVICKGNCESGLIPERARVSIDYDGYWEKERSPFDSTAIRGAPQIFNCGAQQILPGLETAIRTMFKGEESQFVISYRLLFGEIGCVPRIKPKADGLFIIKLIDFVETGDIHALDNVAEEDRNNFSVIFDKAKEVHLQGLDLFRNGNINNAVKAFQRAIQALEFCDLDNEAEQTQQEKFLVKLYLNSAVCFNRLNKSEQACTMCNQIRKISTIDKNCKALFQEGRALFRLCEYDRAKNCLLKAQKIEPKNQEIQNELHSLDKKYREYKENVKYMWTKAVRIKPVNTENKKNEENGDDLLKIKVMNLILDLKKNNKKNILLPIDLPPSRIKIYEDLCKEYDIKLIRNNSDVNTIF